MARSPEFLAAITAAPDDENLRLVYADWLEERGDPLAAAIRMEAQAVQIMGGRRHVRGALDVEEHYEVCYTPEQSLQLQRIPFNATTLRRCKETHVLVAGYPFSLMDIFRKFFPSIYGWELPWYWDRPFACEHRVCIRWYLIRKDPLGNSTSRQWNRQLALLSANEGVPRACELVHAGLLCNWPKANIFLPHFNRVRCSDRVSSSSHIVSNGRISAQSTLNERDDVRSRHIGITSSWKPEEPGLRAQ